MQRTKNISIRPKNIKDHRSDDFKQYLDIAGVMLLVLDSDGKVLLINKKGCEVLGYNEDEIIGVNWFDNFLPQRISDIVKMVFKRLMKGGDPGEYYENPIRRKNGEERIIYWHSSLLYDENGKVNSILSSGEDITEFRKIQDELKRRSVTMEILYTLSREISISADLSDLLKRIGNVITGISMVLSGGFYFHDVKSNSFTLISSFGNELYNDLLPARLDRSTSIVKEILKSNTGFNDEAPIDAGRPKQKLRRLYNPIFAGDELIGIMIFIISDEKEYDMDFFNMVSSETGRGIKRKQAEIALKQSEEKFYTIFQTSPDSIAISTIDDGTYLAVNEKFTEVTGFTPKEIIGKNTAQVGSFISSEDREQLLKELREKGKVTNFETVLLKKDGFFNVLMSAKVIEYGGMQCMLTIVKDISERIKAEQEILATKEMLEKITNTSPAFISLYDIQNDKTLYSNKSLLKSVGYDDEDIKRIASTPTEKRLDIYHPDDVKVIQESDRKILELEDGEIYVLEFRLKDKKGFYHWFRHSTAVYQRDESGISVKSVNIFENITESKRAEVELRKLSVAMEQSPVTIVITDKSGSIEYVNPKFAELTGYTFEDSIGKNPRILRSGMTTKEEYKELWDTILSGKVWRGQFCNKKKSGELFWENATISPIFDGQGNITHFLAVKEDITGKKKSEELIVNRNKEISLLYEAGKKLSATLDLNELYDSMYFTVSEVADCDDLFVSTYNDESKLITYFYLRSKETKERIDVSNIPPIPLAPPGYGIISDAIHTGESKIIDDYQESFKKVKTSYVINEKGGVLEQNKPESDRKPNSAMIVPIKLESKVFGVVQIFSLKRNAFSTEQLNFVESLIHQVALANNNVILYQKAQDEIKERRIAEESLLRSEERLRHFAETVPDVLYHIDLITGKYDFISPSLEKMFGYSVQDALNDRMGFIEKTLHPYERERVLKLMDEFIQGGVSEKPFEIETRMIRTDGTVIWVRDVIRYSWRGPLAVAASGILSDISERKHEEEKQKQRNEQIIMQQSSLLEMSKLTDGDIDSSMKNITHITANTLNADRASIWLFDDSKSNLICNNMFVRETGMHKSGMKLDKENYSKLFDYIESDESEYHSFSKAPAEMNESTVINFDQFNTTSSIIARIRHHGEVTGFIYFESNNLEGKEWTTEQHDFILSTSSFIAVALESDERQKAEQEILKSLKDKELLLREIHHRVKNNLAVISSLLYLQSKKTQNQEVLDALLESQMRIKSMVLVHEKLYRSKDLSSINYAGYIQSLATTLFRSYGYDSKKIKLELDVKELYLDTDSATNLGLIINELISNAVKHGYPDGREGKVTISMNVDERGVYTLMVKDDGKGVPPNFDINGTDTLGLKLVSTLVEQLEGTLQVESNEGTCFKIQFSKHG
ncbi:MAG: PAS domain S-box protein [Ignavibacteria bacterium]|jgi:PAS domain S-box-containing protein